jgi:hypothetical protein
MTKDELIELHDIFLDRWTIENVYQYSWIRGIGNNRKTSFENSKRVNKGGFIIGGENKHYNINS